MSRSFRKTPVFAVTTARSDKVFKMREHRRERRAVKMAVRMDREVPGSRRFGDPWHGEKDGKVFRWQWKVGGDMRK